MDKGMQNRVTHRSSSQVMELQQLIAGPLVATIEADALSAQKCLDFLMRVAFEWYDPVTGKTGPLRMLSFTYAEREGGRQVQKRVSLPLFTLVPLPFLQVQEADFDFDIRILDALTEQTEESFATEQTEGAAARGAGGLRLRASLAPQQTVVRDGDLRQGIAANMKVKVRMGQADMPAGMSNFLRLAAGNVQVDDI